MPSDPSLPLILPRVRVVATPELGDRSYLVHDGRRALVVDAQRDIHRITALAERDGVEITHVFETHVHNDYVSGGLALARATGAAYHVNRRDPVSFDRVEIEDGDVVAVSPGLDVQVLATPGHTPTHLSFVVSSPGVDAPLLLTGGSLLFGGSGRTDLLGHDAIGVLARQQYDSLRRLTRFPGASQVLPTHGFGSYCATTSSGASESTVAVEAATNPDVVSSRESFLQRSQTPRPFPAYYVHMGPANLRGATATPEGPLPRVDGDAVGLALAGRGQVVDLRPGLDFARGHHPGALNIPSGPQLATMVGWLLHPDRVLVLLADTDDALDEARVQLSRVGFDEVVGALVDDVRASARGPEPGARYAAAGFSDLAEAARTGSPQVLDVRHAHEHAASHLRGSLNVPLPELDRARARLSGGHWWVHCASGFRASIAASMLHAAGAQVTVVLDDYATARATSLPVIDGA